MCLRVDYCVAVPVDAEGFVGGDGYLDEATGDEGLGTVVFDEAGWGHSLGWEENSSRLLSALVDDGERLTC